MEYTSFKIPKKSGGFREILAPSPLLKEKQREILKKLYQNRVIGKISPYSYGFIPGRGIYDNARVHAEKKFVLNVDIKDFFPSCKNKRVNPDSFGLTREEFNLLFHEGKLPQGAPTSPIISNMFMADVDVLLPQLLRIRISDDICYSRYADDITISSNSKAIFSPVCMNIIKSVLARYGFSVNEKKTRRMGPSSRKEITGLVVNSGTPTVSRQFRRKLRAAVHNIITGQVTPSKKEINRLKGHLAFCMQVPEHRQWATGLLEKLGVRVKKTELQKKEIKVKNKVQTIIEDYIAGIVNNNISQFYQTDLCKMVVRSKDATTRQKAEMLVDSLQSLDKEWITRKLMYDYNLFGEFVRESVNKGQLSYIEPIVKKIWSKLSKVQRSVLLVANPELKEFHLSI